MKTAVIAGATGLVGSELLRQLLDHERYARVIALTRREQHVDHPRYQNIVTDFRSPEAALAGLSPDDVFCCLGTTMAKAGTKAKFYEVDFHYPLNLAKATLALGATQYLLVSALGADKHSSIYYNRVKGEAEEAVSALGFRTIHIFRPSLFLGPRIERRAGEDAAKMLYKTFGFLIPAKYKGIEASAVAKAMVTSASQDQSGVFIHESKDMQGVS